MSTFRTLRVAHRLALGFGLVLVLLGVVATVAALSLSGARERLHEIVDVNGRQAALAGEMQDATQRLMIAVRDVVLAKAPDEIRAQADQEKRERAAYADAEHRLAALFAQAGTSDEERTLLAAVTREQAKAEDAADRIVALGVADQDEQAVALLTQEGHAAFVRWSAALDALAAHEHAGNDALAAEADAQARHALATMLALALVALVSGSAAAVVIGRSVTVELGGEPAYAADIARQIAAGNLTVDVRLQGGDRGSLLHAMRGMRDDLGRVVARVRQGSEAIATGSHQVAAGSQDLSQRTEEQAANLEQTAASMEQITATVRQNTDNATRASELAGAASQAASHGGEAVARMLATMGEISDSSRRIADITGVIDGIAFQTNLLALNAAVEAARAGEQGRGFAVVAGEVRALAQRAGTAAREIKSLIATSVDRVEAGTRHASAASERMTGIVDQVERVRELVASISTASGEQSVGIAQVGDAVAQLDEVTQQNAALVEESAAAAESLHRQSTALSELVAVFRVSVER